MPGGGGIQHGLHTLHALRCWMLKWVLEGVCVVVAPLKILHENGRYHADPGCDRYSCQHQERSAREVWPI